MKIGVGTTNPVKVAAVACAVKQYNVFLGATVEPVEVSSGVSKQPKSLEETVLGAKNRARAAFEDNDYSFGIESGMMALSLSKGGFMNVCACAIYDGENYSYGLSSAFEYPPKLLNLMLSEGLDFKDAFYKADYTDSSKLGSESGGISVLTNGRLNRTSHTMEAIRAAMVQIENAHFYPKK